MMWIIHPGHPTFWLITVLNSTFSFFWNLFPRQGILKIPAFHHDSPVAQESQRCFHASMLSKRRPDPRAHVLNLPSWNFRVALSLIRLSDWFKVTSIQLSFLKSCSKCSNAEASAAAFLFIRISLCPLLLSLLLSVLICTRELITGRCGSHEKDVL